jgi:hypothetical protein
LPPIQQRACRETGGGIFDTFPSGPLHALLAVRHKPPQKNQQVIDFSYIFADVFFDTTVGQQ